MPQNWYGWFLMPWFNTDGECENEEVNTPTAKTARRGGTGGAKKGGKKAAAAAGMVKPTAAHAAVLSRVEAALKLIGDLVAAVRLPGTFLLPLLRAALQSLAAGGGSGGSGPSQGTAAHALEGLQVTAVGVVASAFRATDGLCPAVFQDAMGAITSAASAACGRSVTAGRCYVAGGEEGTTISPAAALLLLLVQCSVRLPSHADADAESADAATLGAKLGACYRPALYWSDVFWTYVADKLPAARVAKADAELDIKGAMDYLVAGACNFWVLRACLCLMLPHIRVYSDDNGLQHSAVPETNEPGTTTGAVLRRDRPCEQKGTSPVRC